MKKTFIFLIMILSGFAFSFDAYGATFDEDTSNTWTPVGFGLQASSQITDEVLYFSLEYPDSGYWDESTGITDYDALTNDIRSISFYWASTGGIPYTIDQHYYMFSIDYTAGYLETIVYRGNSFGSLTQIDYYYVEATEFTYPVIFIGFNFISSEFKMLWGDNIMVNTADLPGLSEFRTHSHGSYFPTFSIFDRNDNLLAVNPFTSIGDYNIVISNDKTSVLSYYQSKTNFDESYANRDLTFPGQTPPSVDTPLDIILYNTGFFNTPGFLLLFFILIMAFNVAMWYFKIPFFANLIGSIAITAIFMFFGYLPIWTATLMIMIFILITMTLNKGGMLNE